MNDNKLVALVDHGFGTGVRVKGEEYTANDAEAATLKALGWAEDAKEKPAKVEKVEKDLKSDKGKGYNTRDMKAGK